MFVSTRRLQEYNLQVEIYCTIYLVGFEENRTIFFVSGALHSSQRCGYRSTIYSQIAYLLPFSKKYEENRTIYILVSTLVHYVRLGDAVSGVQSA